VAEHISQYGRRAWPTSQAKRHFPLFHAAWAFHLSPSLDERLHWQALVPTTSQSAWSLLVWTVPLVAAYCGLGLLRNQRDSDRWQDSDQRGTLPTFQQLTQVAKLAANHLQRCNRNIRYNWNSDREELRKRFFVYTCLACATSGIWLYGVLPSIVGGAIGLAGVRSTERSLCRCCCSDVACASPPTRSGCECI
jgi:hypothetical protein